MSRFLWGSIFLLVALQVASEDVRTKVVKPSYHRSFTESVAIFEYLSGNKDQAMLELAQDSGIALGDANNVNRDLYRMEQLQHALESNLAGDLPIGINNAMWLDISELRRQQGDCQGALAALFELKQLNTEMDHRERFQRVTCMLQQHSLSQATLVAAEVQALQAEGTSIWLAYIYNNLAVAAQDIGEYILAQAYFKRALSYTDKTEEGKSLASYLKLNMAYSYFNENRYDFALATFAELREDTEWLDLGLLGFGWSAYNNDQAGLALEAWRQLVRLPFKSINIYEGYIAIPFALERQNAFLEALAAYRDAIDRYQVAIGQIDKLSTDIDLDAIHQHAIEYEYAAGDEVNPIHPLLVSAYSQSSFQDVFDTIGLTDRYLQKIGDLENDLAAFSESRKEKLSRSASFQRSLLEKESVVENQLNDIAKRLDFSSELMLAEAFSQHDKEPYLYKAYRQYQRVLEGLKTPDAKMKMDLNRIKGVLMGRLHEDRAFFVTGKNDMVALTEDYKKLNGQYQLYLKTKKNLHYSDAPDRNIQKMQQQLIAAKGLVIKVQANAEQLLLDKTLESLIQQRKQLVAYENQARIAATRLSEEFYQKGGQRLWR